jgi:hypothetical protein
MCIFRSFVLAIIAVLLLQPVSGNPALAFQQSQPKDGPGAFTDQIATRLLDQIKEGLEGHMAKKMLDSFDISRMTGGPVFKEQIVAFVSQYETVRIHFNLLETSTSGAEAIALVDMEMEENPPGDVSAPVHKHTQLRFVAQNGAKGWKFTDVQPRSFFT